MSFDLQWRQLSAITVSCKEDNKHECHMSLTTMLTVPICSFVSFLDIDHRVQLFCGHKQSSWCSSLLQCPPTQRLKKIKTDLFLSSQGEPSYCCVLYSPLILVHFSSVGPFFFFFYFFQFFPPPLLEKQKQKIMLDCQMCLLPISVGTFAFVVGGGLCSSLNDMNFSARPLSLAPSTLRNGGDCTFPAVHIYLFFSF